MTLFLNALQQYPPHLGHMQACLLLQPLPYKVHDSKIYFFEPQLPFVNNKLTANGGCNQCICGLDKS